MSQQHLDAPAVLRISGTIQLDPAPSDAARAVLSRPKQLALLAIVACAPDRMVRRDSLLALLWSELDQERARAALRKAVFSIRRDLGADVLVGRGAEEIALGPAIDCDVLRFRSQLASGDVRRALDEYGGTLLPGFHLNQEPEFERWLDSERERLNSEARRALLSAFRRSGQPHADIEAERLVELSQRFHPDDETLLRECMAVLHRSEDATGGLRLYERFRTRLEQELEATPSAETERLAAELRAAVDAGAQSTGAAPVQSPGAVVPESSTGGRQVGLQTAGSQPAESQGAVVRQPLPAPANRGPWWRPALIALAVVLLPVGLLLGSMALRSQAAERPEAQTLAVAGIASYIPQDTGSAAALADMLSTSLARIPGLAVHSTLRLYEAADGDLSMAGLSRAASRIGATHALEGGLHPGENGGVRLELRRVDLRTGTVTGSYRVQAQTSMDAVNRATVQLATTFGLPAPTSTFASATTQSMRAYELYEQGLRAWYGSDVPKARDLFRAAVAQDSTFAMATWMLANSLAWQPEWIPTFDRAVRLADGATERERLMIRASYLAAMEDPSRLQVADSLAARYPHEPMGHQLVAEALLAAGRPLDAVPWLNNVLGLDTLSLLDLSPSCVACEAFWHLGAAYFGADSAEAGIRAWQSWARATPAAAAPWSWLAFAYESLGQYEEAEDALQRMRSLDPDYGNFEIRLAGQRLHANRLTSADSILDLQRRKAGSDVLPDLFWNLALLRMNEGRYTEALAFADSFRLADPSEGGSNLRGVVLLNAGRAREAAALFDSLVEQSNRYTMQSRRGRDMAMNRTNYADAVAALPDASRLRTLEDSVRQWGAMSGYERDRIIHHHVRGLRLRVEGRLEESAAEFQRAQFGPRSAGYARTNLELARVLLESERPREALRPLRLNLEAAIGASNIWASRTEARELLGIAHDRLGNADSARAHYGEVLSAWRNADPELRARRGAIDIRLRTLNARKADRGW